MLGRLVMESSLSPAPGPYLESQPSMQTPSFLSLRGASGCSPSHSIKPLGVGKPTVCKADIGQPELCNTPPQQLELQTPHASSGPSSLCFPLWGNAGQMLVSKTHEVRESHADSEKRVLIIKRN